jgi:hypothetical protein
VVIGETRRAYAERPFGNFVVSSCIVIVQKSSLQLNGEARFHRIRGGSGSIIERGFCPDCGSPLFVKLERFPAVLGIQAGSLDDPDRHKPSMDLFTESAPPWDAMRILSNALAPTSWLPLDVG